MMIQKVITLWLCKVTHNISCVTDSLHAQTLKNIIRVPFINLLFKFTVQSRTWPLFVYFGEQLFSKRAEHSSVCAPKTQVMKNSHKKHQRVIVDAETKFMFNLKQQKHACFITLYCFKRKIIHSLVQWSE